MLIADLLRLKQMLLTAFVKRPTHNFANHLAGSRLDAAVNRW
jgi:hypothetical protein